MMKKILATSLIGTILLFSGCTTNDAESNLETQKMLDDRDYQGVISKLAGTPDSVDKNMALGAAYMGRSGVGLSDVMTIMLDSNSSSAFTSFTDGINKKKSPTALKDLQKSSKYYDKAAGGACSSEDLNLTLTNSQKDVCMNAGLADVVSTVVTISYLGDIASLTATAFDANASDELAASSCAMQYAFSGAINNTNCSGVEDGNVSFANDTNYTRFYVKMLDTNNTYDYLLTAPVAGIRQTALTDGYCASDSFTRYDINVSERKITTYPLYVNGTEVNVCPVNEDAAGDELTAANIMVDILNGGLDSISTATGGDSELTAQIEKFKSDIKADNNSSDSNTTITMEDIISYLNK